MNWDKKNFWEAADLFCGAGGTTSGLLDACVELQTPVHVVAINHWKLAIETHIANHPYFTHLCDDLDNVNPRSAIPGRKLRILVGSPDCTHFSVARGGTPCDEQMRASIWHIVTWAKALDIEDIIVENVQELRSAGPLNHRGRPIESRKGEEYLAFLNALRSLGYAVEDRILCAADFGDPTSRRRLFIRARKGKRKIAWPDPTHAPAGSMLNLPEYRTAREIINWMDKGKSIFERKRPLAKSTMKRIMTGLKKYSGKPFILGTGGPSGQGRPAGVGQPLQTVLAENHRGVVEPFLVMMYGTNDARSVDRPMPTITAKGQHIGVAEPLVVKEMTASGLEPYLVPCNHGKDDTRAYSVNRPIPTLTSFDAMAIAEPQVVEIREGIDLGLRFSEPFIIKYYGTGTVQPIHEPLDTITSHDRFGICMPLENGYAIIDVLFRMLQPEELARAHSLDGYIFKGTREERVKMIGNSVPRKLAKAICFSALAN